MTFLNIPALTEQQELRFTKKIVVADSGCHEWTGNTTRTKKGYGEFWLTDRAYRAHRVAYKLEYGDIPTDLELDHLCENTCCVNPAHLEPVTTQENLARRTARTNARKASLV